MKVIVHLTLYCCLLMIFQVVPVGAQQFKWVRGGGSTQSIVIGSTPGATMVEATYNMCTDQNGNVYALTNVGTDAPIIADTFNMPAGGYGAPSNIFLTSYGCNGKMRWAKLIGSNDGITGFNIAADSNGHIYLTGDFYHGHGTHTAYVGYDTAITGFRYGTCGIIQFDTTGHFNWVRFVGTNTPPTLGLGGFHNPIAVDGANNVHYFCYMRAGVDLTFVGSVDGVYDLVYSTTGTYLSATRLNMGPQWMLRSTVIDPITSKLYVCGEINQAYFGGSAIDTFFAAAFDASRNLLWQHFTTGGLENIALDSKKQLYIAGGSNNSFSFNGYSASAPGFATMALIMKTDSLGSVKWLRHFDSHVVGDAFLGIALLGNDKVAGVGGYLVSTTDGVHTLNAPPATRYNPYFAITDTGGTFIEMQQMICHGSGDNCGAFAAASDRLGNLYIGGAVEDSVFAGTPPIPAYHTNGGNTDFFIAKYGYNCGCTPAPVIASFTAAGTHTVSATYTGTTASVDSIVWTFGDGGRATGMTPTHVYGASGTYTICVTVYTGCGNDTHCSSVVVSVPTTGLSPREGEVVKVYPNPAKEEVLVTGLTLTTAYRLLNIAGLAVQHGQMKSGNTTLTLHSLPPGIYILELTNNDGVRNNVRVVKE